MGKVYIQMLKWLSVVAAAAPKIAAGARLTAMAGGKAIVLGAASAKLISRILPQLTALKALPKVLVKSWPLAEKALMALWITADLADALGWTESPATIGEKQLAVRDYFNSNPPTTEASAALAVMVPTELRGYVAKMVGAETDTPCAIAAAWAASKSYLKDTADEVLAQAIVDANAESNQMAAAFDDDETTTGAVSARGEDLEALITQARRVRQVMIMLGLDNLDQLLAVKEVLELTTSDLSAVAPLITKRLV